MRFAFSEDQIEFRDAVRELLANECPPEVVRPCWTNDSGREPKLWSKLAEMGVVGMTAPEAAGGLDMHALDTVLIFEECGYAALPEPIVDTTAVAIPLLVDVGRSDLAEAAAGGDTTVAVGLAGEPYVVGAEAADLLVLEHGDEVHAVAPADVSLEAHESVDGSRRLTGIEWTPGPATLIGADAGAALEGARKRATVATSAFLVGLGRHMLDVTVEYTKAREQFGQPIGSFQAIKHHLADALLQLEYAAPVTYRAAYSLVGDDPGADVHLSMAKAYASDAAWLTAGKALQAHGAIGYSYEYDLQLWMKRAWALAFAYGDAATHRARIAEAVI